MKKSIPFHSIPFHSIPFHSIPFHSIPFHSIPFHSIPFLLLILLLSGCRHEPQVELTEIFVSATPKTEYTVGDKVDYTGLEVSAKYSNETTKIIQDYTITPEEGTALETAGEQIVSISFEEKETSFTIKVKAVPVPEEETPEEEIEYKLELLASPQNQTFDIYSNLTDKKILKSKVSASGRGKVQAQWYIIYGYNKDATPLGRIQEKDIEAEATEYEFELEIPKINYLKNKIFCHFSIFDEEEKATVDSEECDIVQNMIDTGLPVITINTKDNAAIVSREDWLETSLDIQGEIAGFSNFTQTNVSIKCRGNSSYSFPKKSFSIKLDKAPETEILNMPSHKRWVLIANYSDKTLLRNKYASYLGNEIFTNMNWNPHFESIDLIINEEYFGTYLFGEQIKIDKNRVNIQSIKDTVKGQNKKGTLIDYNGDGVIDYQDGGFIVEINARMDEAYNFKTEHGVCISLKDPDVEDFLQNDTDCKEYIKNIIQNAEDSIFSSDFDNPDIGYAKYIDVDSFIDWWFVNELTKNNDAIFFSSVYMYYDPSDGLLHMGPDWDFDISCGNVYYNNCDNPHGWYIKNAKWYNRLFDDTTFNASVIKRWKELSSQVLLSLNYLETESLFINSSQELNFTRWNILGTYVWPNPKGYDKRVTYNDEFEYLYNWVSKRIVWLEGELK